jgi:sugar lactone lactonase YvrE
LKTVSGQPECIWPLAAELGEGPLWWNGALWFTDIRQDRIHCFDPGTRQGKSWEAPAAPGFLAPLQDGGFLVGAKLGLFRFDPDHGDLRFLEAVEPDRLGNRLNDGAVDPLGRLWFGSMDDAEKDPSGVLYCLDPGGPKAMDQGYVITNGPAFSPDGRTLYHTDTLERLIYRFDVSEDGTLSNKRIFARIEDGAGYPDGPTVDAESCLWTGLFGGWAARRYAPDGRLLSEVRFPVANVTKLAFAGTTAYATTAWKGLDKAARSAQPLAGGLFRFEVKIPGLPQKPIRDG